MQIALYLARHAHALDDAPSDEERPLSSKGITQMAKLVESLDQKSLVQPEMIWQSGLLRARETAVALQSGLNWTSPLTEKNGLRPMDDPRGIAAELNELSQSCLVVGHNPSLSRLASLLLTDSADFERIVFSKASMLCLSRMTAGNQSTPWNIEWHIQHQLFK